MILETQLFTEFKSAQFLEWSTNTILLSSHLWIDPLVALRPDSAQWLTASLPLMISAHSIQLRAMCMELPPLNQPNRLLPTSKPSTISKLVAMVDPLTCRRSAQFRAWQEKISQRKMATSVTLRSTLMFRDLGFTPRMLPLLQCANSQKWPSARFSPMTTRSLSHWAMESGLRNLSRMLQLSSAEFAPMLLSRRTTLSPESD